MKYATIKKNDTANAQGVCVSIFLQGCPHHCKNCFNPETWDFNGGKNFTNDTLGELIEALRANGIKRDLCILGGEPLCKENIGLTATIALVVKEKLPDTKIYIWTGYYLKDLLECSYSSLVKMTLNRCEALIDGPYIDEERDITLNMRGSRNQNIIYIKDIKDLISK